MRMVTDRQTPEEQDHAATLVSILRLPDIPNVQLAGASVRRREDVMFGVVS